MSTIFDGTAGLLNDVFGGSVTYLPIAAGSRAVQGIFREAPVDLVDADGHLVRGVQATWRVRRDLVPGIARHDRLQLADGRVFEVQAVWPGGSPATDAFVLCDLFRVEP